MTSKAKINSRMERCEKVNDLLRCIGEVGRRFFHHDGRYARFEVGLRGRVWLHDHYSRKRIYTHYPYRWRGFTNGGTLKALCIALRDFIMRGKPVKSGHFGPWPDWYCGGDLWGYGDAMEGVRAKALELGVTQQTKILAESTRTANDLRHIDAVGVDA